MKVYLRIPFAILCAALAAAGADDFPSWRGVHGSGAAHSGLKLVDDITFARRRWKSEYVPGVYGSLIQTGNSGVSVADGKVVLVYHWPNDDVYDVAYVKKMLDTPNWNAKSAYALDPEYKAAVDDPTKREAYARKKFAVSADDVVLCLDADTGKTLWKRVYKRKGINCTKQGRGPFICAKCAPQSIPCIAAGKVFALGNTGRVYALNAADGASIWESNLGAIFQRLEAVREKAREQQSLPGYGRKDLAHGPVYADGVLVCYDDESSLIGFDPETGRKLWTARGQGMSKYYSSPMLWPHGGRTYVVAGGNLLDPKAGKILWSVPGQPCKEPGTASVCGDYLFWKMVCYRISPEKAAEVWRYPSGQSSRDGTPVIQNGMLLFRNQERGTVELYDLAAGRKLALTRSPPGISTENGSFVGGDGRGFLELGRDGGSAIGMFMMEPGTTDMKPTALAVPHYAMSTTPVYCNGRLYLRMLDHVACWDLAEPGPEELARMRAERAEMAAALMAELQSGDPGRTHGALGRLQKMGGAGKKVIVEAFDQAVMKEDDRIFEGIFATVTFLDNAAAATAMAHLDGALRGAHAGMRDAAIRLTAQLSYAQRAEVKPSLVRLLNGEDRGLWYAAGQAIGRIDAASYDEALTTLATAMATVSRDEDKHDIALIIARLVAEQTEEARKKKWAATVVPVLEDMMLLSVRVPETEPLLDKLKIGRPPSAVPDIDDLDLQ